MLTLAEAGINGVIQSFIAVAVVGARLAREADDTVCLTPYGPSYVTK